MWFDQEQDAVWIQMVPVSSGRVMYDSENGVLVIQSLKSACIISAVSSFNGDITFLYMV